MATVHWHEGLFLQAHHLQMAAREGVERLGHERRLSWAYPYGVIESRLSADALENFQIRFDRLRAIMPSGIEVDVPTSAELAALDIKRAFAASSSGFTVSLAVPLWQQSRANTVEGVSAAGTRAGVDASRVKRLYRISEQTRTDENTGENPQPVLVRKLNARLVLDGEDTTDMEVLPLLRVGHGVGDDQALPKVDPAFVPPCLVVAGSAALRTQLRDLANQVEASRKDLVFQITRGGFSIENLRGPQIEQMMRLTALNRFAGRLSALSAAVQTPGGGGQIAPFDVYLELRDLLSELAALYPDRDPWEAARYDHDKPAVSLMDLDQRVRQLLRGAVVKKFLLVPFALDGGVLGVVLGEEHLTQPNEYYLGIKTKQDPSVLAKLVEDRDKFKLMPKSMGKLNIFGVKLEEERHPPMELPSQVGLHYFRLNRAETSKQIWDRVVAEKAMALRWPEADALDAEVGLYMTVP